MGSSLDPASANIFVGYYEGKLLKRVTKPLMYRQYVDDTFTVFHNKAECNEFFTHLNSLHPSLLYIEKENDNPTPFTNVLMEKSDSRFMTSVHRKPTFLDEYIRYNSFCSKKRKINPISTLVHRAFAVCSQSTLQAKLTKIRTIFWNNGYLDHVVNTILTEKIQQFHKSPHFGSKKCSQCTYIYNVWKMFRQSLKLRSRQLLNAVSLRSNLVTPTPPDNCQQPIRKYSLILIISTLSINSCATAIVSTWFVLPKGCNKRSNNIFRKPSCADALHLTAGILLAPSNSIEAHLEPCTQQLVNTLCKTHRVRRNTMKENSQSSPKDAQPLIFPLLKPHTCKH